MTAHRVAYDMQKADLSGLDPGDAGTFVLDRFGVTVPMVSAAAETRILAQPTSAGEQVTLVLDTDGGDITLTVTGGYDVAGNTTITFDTAGEHVTFVSVEVGGSYYWRALGPAGAFQQAHVADPAASSAVTFTHSWNGATSPTAGEGAALITDLGALKTAIDANNAAIDSILVQLAALGLQASS